MDPFDRLDSCARRAHDVFTRSAALCAGVTADQLRWHSQAGGRWRRFEHGVCARFRWDDIVFHPQATIRRLHQLVVPTAA